MFEIFLTALCLSLIVQFIYSLFWEGMIFGRMAGWLMFEKPVKDKDNNTKWFKPRLSYWLQKPLFRCPICMTPYYSVIILAVLHYFNYLTFPVGIDIFIILIASGLSVIFSRTYD